MEILIILGVIVGGWLLLRKKDGGLQLPGDGLPPIFLPLEPPFVPPPPPLPDPEPPPPIPPTPGLEGILSLSRILVNGKSYSRRGYLGKVTTISATVKNVGDSSLSYSIFAEFQQVFGKLETYGGTLAPGASMTHVWTVTPQETRSYILGVTANGEHRTATFDVYP